MKNWDKKPESLFKKKGFYVALYSCLGIVMISAAALSFTSLLKSDPPKPLNMQAELDYGNTEQVEVQPVDKSNTQSYLTPEDRDILQAVPTGILGAVGTPRPTSQPTADAAATDAAATQAPVPSAAPDEAKTETDRESAEDIIAPAETVTEKTAPSAVEQNIAAVAPAKKESEGFSPYTAEAPMTWPLVGELVMDFSTDRLIYDATLNQYRTNNNLCIAASIGTQVKAAAAGVVKEIDKTREKGNTVTIDHGNGWTTVYSELQDGILVSIGEVVKEGQVIGGVGNPAIYNVLMGSHLQFAVAKDGAVVDPKKVLAN